MSGPTILVFGPGQAAIDAAMEIRDQGVRVVLVRPQGSYADLAGEMHGIEVLSDNELLRLDGVPGDFRALLGTVENVSEIRCAAVVMAPEPLPPPSSGTVAVMTLFQACQDGIPDAVGRLAIVLGPDSTRSSFVRAVELAIRARALPKCPMVWVFAEEMQAYGTDELVYADAQAAGVTFVRTKGSATLVTDPLSISALDVPSEVPMNIYPDLLVVDGVPDHEGLMESGPVQLNKGPVGHVSMGPVASMREGVFISSSLAGGSLEGESRVKARAAAARAVTLVLNPPMRSAAVVDREKCSACLTCVRNCPFLAARPGDEGKAVIDSALCQACGVCVGGCPSRALSLPGDEAMRPGTDLEEGG